MANSNDWMPEKIDETFLKVAEASPFYSALEKSLATRLLALQRQNYELLKVLNSARSFSTRHMRDKAARLLRAAEK